MKGIKYMNNIEKMFKETTVCKTSGERRRFYKGKYWYRVLWDLCNPDQPCEGFIIHHIDGNELNDDISNLARLTRAEHNKIHNTGINRSEETKQKISLANTGKIRSEETKRKISENHADYSGANNPAARSVSINGQLFSTLTESAQYLSMSVSGIIRRIKSKNFPGYSYIEGDN